MSSKAVGLVILVLLLSALVTPGCRPPTPRDVASAERCDDLEDDHLAALYAGTIARVERIDASPVARGADASLRGAAIHLRDASVDDDALLARALACHASHADIDVSPRAAPHIDPLRPPGGEVQVAVERRDDDIVVVRLTSRVETVAAEILHRAEVLEARARERARRVASDP